MSRPTNTTSAALRRSSLSLRWKYGYPLWCYAITRPSLSCRREKAADDDFEGVGGRGCAAVSPMQAKEKQKKRMVVVLCNPLPTSCCCFCFILWFYLLHAPFDLFSGCSKSETAAALTLTSDCSEPRDNSPTPPTQHMHLTIADGYRHQVIFCISSSSPSPSPLTQRSNKTRLGTVVPRLRRYGKYAMRNSNC